MVRLIATDLDGTLLGPDGRIPERNVAALRAAHRAGVAVVVATGRPARWLDCLAPIADLAPLVVASNGAVVYDLADRRVVRHHTFGPRQVTAIVAAVRTALPHAAFGLERGDRYGTEPHSPADDRHQPDVLVRPVGVLIGQITPVVKILVYSAEDTTDQVAASVREAVGSLATVTTSMGRGPFGLAELSVPGITKARTLQELSEDLGIAAADIAAFGDMPNDVEMLDWVGRAFVTANAHPLLLGRFPAVPACGEAGVGQTIVELLAGMRS